MSDTPKNKPETLADSTHRAAGVAGRDFATAAREAFDAAKSEGRSKSIMCGWSKNVLIIAVTGSKAVEIDQFLRGSGLAEPDGHAPSAG